mmetsp:Transcript_60036/g.106264  ORF Transcript_60036/g.106264 Transcript_60036/m.106264 type:complete len:105 (+) Transcript_60036:227-541(+)
MAYLDRMGSERFLSGPQEILEVLLSLISMEMANLTSLLGIQINQTNCILFQHPTLVINLYHLRELTWAMPATTLEVLAVEILTGMGSSISSSETVFSQTSYTLE